MSPNIAYMRYTTFSGFENPCQVIKCKKCKKIIEKAELIP